MSRCKQGSCTSFGTCLYAPLRRQEVAAPFYFQHQTPCTMMKKAMSGRRSAASLPFL